VRSRWGSAGRINLIGTLCLEGEIERLEYSLIEGSYRSGEVKDCLNALVEQAQQQEGKPSCVIVLDNTPFHTAGMTREREERWEAREGGCIVCHLTALT
jgi:putative transposase